MDAPDWFPRQYPELASPKYQENLSIRPGDFAARLDRIDKLTQAVIEGVLAIDRGERTFNASFAAVACRLYPALTEAEPEALTEGDWPHFREMLASQKQQLREMLASQKQQLLTSAALTRVELDGHQGDWAE
jgi:hypothetical protein